MAVYVFILLVIRLLREGAVGNFGAFDLLVALMLGEIVDQIIYGDVSWSRGAVAILVIASIKHGGEWLSYLSPGVQPLLSDESTAQSISGAELSAALRVRGVETPAAKSPPEDLCAIKRAGAARNLCPTKTKRPVGRWCVTESQLRITTGRG